MNMYDRSYGSSGYHPSNHFKKEEKPEAPQTSKAKRFLNRLGQWALVFVIIILIGLWLLLGEFRFLMTKYPALAGFPFGSRNYIVLFQNNYELRPTGGFISTYGELKFKNGVYKGIEFKDVYGEIDEHPFVDPPLVLSALLDNEGYQGHTFRDANYDPDFTSTKAELIEFYQLTNPDQRVDGIIAADFTFLETLIGLYEPLNVEGNQLTQANAFETLSSVASDIDRHNLEALDTRKNIAGPVVKKIIRKSAILPWRIRTVLRTASQGFEEKHLVASFERKRIEKIFAKRSWNGALPDSNAGDFLVINDANYGGMKSNRYITRDVTYELDVTDARDILGNPVVKAKVTVQLSHEGTWNIPLSGPYTGWLRVLVPLGSDSESDTVEDREDSLVLGNFVELQPGEKTTFTYEYDLPEYVWIDDSYFLTLFKQAGTQADRYRVVVRVPQGMSVDSPQMDVRENVAFYEGNLLTDVTLNFSMLEDKNAPRVVMHEVTGLNEITVVFNEQVSPEYAGNPLNYQILDMNFTDAEVSDTITIQNIRVDGAAVIIGTSGMTVQPEERYEVQLRDIRDLRGNFIDPSPRTLTVVQRNIPEIEEEEEEVIIPDPEPLTEPEVTDE